MAAVMRGTNVPGARQTLAKLVGLYAREEKAGGPRFW
jgi:hypothetical protein